MRLPILRFRFLPLALTVIFSCVPSGALQGQDTAPVPAPATRIDVRQNAEPDRNVSWLQLPSNILHDQKAIWLFPTKVARGKHLLPVFAVTGVTAGLIAADPHDAPYFRRTSSFQNFN